MEKSKMFSRFASKVVSGMPSLQLPELELEIAIPVFFDSVDHGPVRIQEHEHPFCEVVWMIAGEMTYFVNGRKLVNRENSGQLIIIPCGFPHRRCSSSECAVIRSLELGITPTGSCPNRWLDTFSVEWEKRGFRWSMNAAMRARLGLIERESTRGDSFAVEICRHELAVFILDLLRELVPEPARQKLPYTNQIRGGAAITDYILMRLDDMSNRPLEIAALTNYFHLSARHLNRLFRHRFGKSIACYAAERRILHAKRLLTDSSNSVDEVARALGFSSTSYFISFFKKHVGMTPGKFKENLRLGTARREKGSYAETFTHQ